MPSTPSRSISSSPESIYTHETRRDASSPRHSYRHSSDRLSVTKIASILRYDEQQSKDLRRMLLTVTEQLKQESQRADDNERRAREAIQRFRAINEARVAAQQDAARANEELRMYKLQLEYAQREIFRAQDILDSSETQRHDAETSAARARNVARKLREEGLVDLAREEGRRLGLQEGLARGHRFGSDHARSTPDRRDSRLVRSIPSHVDDQEDHVRSAAHTQTPVVAEPPLEPIEETMLNFPPSPPTANAPNPEVLSHPEPAPTPPNNLPPMVVSAALSPSRRRRSINLQDGFIPHAENDSIRIPPPHEMAQPVAPSPTLDIQLSIESEPLMVRDPGVRHEIVPLEPESPGSTTISQFELVSDPSGSVSRQSRRKRRSLSVIPEAVSGDNTPAAELMSISSGRGSRPASASVSHGPPLASPSAPRSPSFVPAPANIADGFREPDPYVYRRPSYASSSSSGSVRVIQQTPARSTRSLARMSSSSSVPNIIIEAPSRSQSQTPQATPYMSHAGNFLSADDAHRPSSPTISALALDPSSSPVVPQDSSAGPAGDLGQPVITLSDGQLPRGFVPVMTVLSPSQPPPPQLGPTFSYTTPSAPTSGAVMSPRMSAHTDPRAPYGVPVPDASSSSGRLSLNSNSVRVPVTSTTTGESSVMVPPASIFSQPNELSSETDEDDAVASSIASSNDTFTTPPPSSKKLKAKRSRRPAYDAAPVPPGQAYPSSPLQRANTLPSPGPSATSASQGRRGPAGMTPASRHRNLNN